jgi:hypothetical protein
MQHLDFLALIHPHHPTTLVNPMNSLIPLSPSLANAIPPKTQKQCQQEVAMRGIASQLIVGMHFRLNPHGREARSSWYRVQHIDSETREVTAKALNSPYRGLQISQGVNVLRLISEDKHLA